MKPADKAKTAERTAKPAAARVLLLVPSRTYRAADFLTAAARLGLDLVVGSDGALPLGGRPVVHADPSDPAAAPAGSWPRPGRSTRLSPRTRQCWSWRRRWLPAWVLRITRWKR